MTSGHGVSVVTGGCSGIGAATVELLTRRGDQVVRWDHGGQPDIHVDVSDHAAVVQAMERTIDQFGSPTSFVNCAGINGRAPLLETTIEDWDRITDVNLRGAFICLQAAAGAMKDTGTGGSIILVASTAAILADPATVPYSLSKAGVLHLARVAAVELGQWNIRVNAVSPGPTATPMTQRTLGRQDYRDTVTATTPLGGVASASDIADVIVGLDGFRWVTGENVTVDGGTSLVTPRGALRASYGSFVGTRTDDPEPAA